MNYNSNQRTSGRSGSFRSSSSSRSGSRPSFGGGRSGGGRRFERPRGIDVSSFINKSAFGEKEEIFTPDRMFADFNVSSKMKINIINKGYKVPTPIQDKCIPHILEGKDIVGMANTGTGKTAAFLIPLINKVLEGKNEQVMILTPTRELAIQINEEFMDFSRGFKIFSVCCVGGAGIRRQMMDLNRQNHFIIGTPGRVQDLMRRRCIDPSQFRTLVLDEADRMLDMGFIDDMRAIAAKMPKERQTLFFSATITKDIEKLIGDFLTAPVRISVAKREVAINVEQDVVRVERGANKIDVLHDLLIGKDFKKVLIFGATKIGVERLSVALNERGFKAESIHGDKPHSKRQRALGQFKENRVQILVATDVAARGLDIDNVSHVINYDLPATHEDYIHRIGRTGRGTNKGKALTFVS